MNITFLLFIIYTVKIFPTSSHSWSFNELKNAKQAGAKMECLRNSALFTKNENFQVPCGVASLRVLVVGGGSAGEKGEYRGGSSGFVSVCEVSVTPLAYFNVTVGKGGNNSQAGGSSSFDSCVANGGNIAGGGSGGGEGKEFDCTSGNGGSNGTNGGLGTGGSWSSGVGIGQGSYTWKFAILKYNKISPGPGGSGTGLWRGPGGGGGGGVLINNRGPMAGNGESSAGGEGGKGYGAGGGAGGYTTNYTGRAQGGAGADGVVYIEWW